MQRTYRMAPDAVLCSDATVNLACGCPQLRHAISIPASTFMMTPFRRIVRRELMKHCAETLCYTIMSLIAIDSLHCVGAADYIVSAHTRCELRNKRAVKYWARLS